MHLAATSHRLSKRRQAGLVVRHKRRLASEIRGSWRGSTDRKAREVHELQLPNKSGKKHVPLRILGGDSGYNEACAVRDGGASARRSGRATHRPLTQKALLTQKGL